MTTKDSKRCVDKTQIGEDVIGTLTIVGVFGLIVFIIGATGYTAHIIGAKLLRFEPCVEPLPTDTYAYRGSRDPCGDPYRPALSFDSFMATIGGVFALIVFLGILVIIIDTLVNVYNRYYPMCRDLKKRDKERCKKTKQTKK